MNSYSQLAVWTPVSSINAIFRFCSEMVIDSNSANEAYLEEPYRLQDRNRTLDTVTTSGDSAYASLHGLISALVLLRNWCLDFFFTCSNRHCCLFRVVPETEFKMSICVWSATRAWDDYHVFTTDSIPQLMCMKKKERDKTEHSFPRLDSITCYLFKQVELHQICFPHPHLAILSIKTIKRPDGKYPQQLVYR